VVDPAVPCTAVPLTVTGYGTEETKTGWTGWTGVEEATTTALTGVENDLTTTIAGPKPLYFGTSSMSEPFVEGRIPVTVAVTVTVESRHTSLFIIKAPTGVDARVDLKVGEAVIVSVVLSLSVYWQMAQRFSVVVIVLVFKLSLSVFVTTVETTALMGENPGVSITAGGG
jgi:hypothetical protein